MTSGPAHIQVDGLTFRYRGRKLPALRDVSFEVPRGGSLLLLGPSGCGKSTLGLCLNGGIPHFVEGELLGSVRIEGRDTREASMAEMAQRVGVVFQDPEAQFCMLSVEEEVAFGLENLAVPRHEMDSRIDEALDQVGLGGRRGDHIERLSGGQKQRLALACVLAQRPDVLVFDEPTAQLDPAAAADVMELFARLRRKGRHTMVVIEHRLDDLMPLVDQVLVLDRSGQVVADGPPRKVLRERANWLAEAGVWVPQVSELATAMADRGIELDPFPLTVEEAACVLHGVHFACRHSSPETGVSKPFASARHLSFRYAGSDRPALTAVDLPIRGGEVAAIVGANGAGKSTLARSFVRLLPTPPRQVFLGDRDVTQLTRGEIARTVGYVFQYPEHQFIGRSVYEDVTYGLRRSGRSELAANQIALALLEQFGLESVADAHPYALSHGEQRRLSVAAMLALGQQGLFLDEPTLGQDRRNAHLLFEKLRELAWGGRAVVAITHDMRLVAEVATRTIAMSAGGVVFDGPPAELFRSPALLDQAGLRPPPVTQLGHRLGFPKPVLSVQDILQGVAPLEKANL
jgi:energy-coupling factor transport system ATP-binding protein